MRRYGKYAHEKLGLSGLVIKLLGETCKTERDFEVAERTGRKRGQTYIDKRAVDVVLNAIGQSSQ